MKLIELIAQDSKNINYIRESALIFRKGRLEKSRKMDQKQGTPLLCRLESVKFWTRILENLPAIFSRHSITILLHYNKYSLKFTLISRHPSPKTCQPFKNFKMVFNVSVLSLGLAKTSLRKLYASLRYLGKSSDSPGLLRVKFSET